MPTDPEAAAESREAQDDPRIRRAECCCGQLFALCAGEPIRVSVCHCLACKRRTGSAFSTNVLAPVKDTKIEGPVKEYSVKALSGNTGKRKSLFR